MIDTTDLYKLINAGGETLCIGTHDQCEEAAGEIEADPTLDTETHIVEAPAREVERAQRENPGIFRK